MHNNGIAILSFKNGLTNLFSLTGFYFKSKIVEGSHKGKICFLIFGNFFLKCEVVTFFYCTVAVHIYKIHVLDDMLRGALIHKYA